MKGSMKNCESARAEVGVDHDRLDAVTDGEFLALHLIEVRRLHAMASGHPVMFAALAEREKELMEKLALL
jgi:hypothetical protein